MADAAAAAAAAAAEQAAAEYESSLSDLTINSKPLINMLTMLAEENIALAPLIVKTIENHFKRVSGDVKLPVLYLVDSILKNVGKEYTSLFLRILVSMFCGAFEKVDEKIRSQMYKLRQTWSDVLPSVILYDLDSKVNAIDPAWPIAALPAVPSSNNRIHLNPKFLNSTTPSVGATVATPPVFSPTPIGSVPLPKVSGTASSAKDLKRLMKHLEEEHSLLDSKLKAKEQQKQLLAKQQASRSSGELPNVDASKLAAQHSEALKDLHGKLADANKLFTSGNQLPANKLAALREAMSKKHILEKIQAFMKSGQMSEAALLQAILSDKKIAMSDVSSPPSLVVNVSSPVYQAGSAPTKSKALSSLSHESPLVKTEVAGVLPTNDSTATKKTESVRGKPVTSPSQASRPAISPASSLLINAATQRVRDPRLRKLKDDKDDTPTELSASVAAPVSSLLLTASQTDSIINNGTTSSPCKAADDLESEEAKASKPEKKGDRRKDKEKRRKTKKSSKSESHSSSPSKQSDLLNHSMMEKFLENIAKGSRKTDKLESDGRVSVDPKKRNLEELERESVTSLIASPDPAATKSEIVMKPVQDVDLRVLPTSPSKKRVSDAKSDEPPQKKNKAEIYNMLFGHEDVDLRQDVDLRPNVDLRQLQLPVTGVPLISPTIVATTQQVAAFDSALKTSANPATRPESSKTTKGPTTNTSSPKREVTNESPRASGSKSKSESRKTGEKSSKKHKKSPSPPLSKTPSPPPPPIISVNRDSPLKESTKENSRLWAKYKEVKPDAFKSPYRIPTKRFNPRQELLSPDPHKLDHVIQHQSPLSYRSELDSTKETRSYVDNQHLTMNSYRSSYYTDLKHSNDISSVGERRPKSTLDMKPGDDISRPSESHLPGFLPTDSYRPELRTSEALTVKTEAHASPKIEMDAECEVSGVLPEPPKPPSSLLPPLPQPLPMQLPQPLQPPLLQPPILTARPMGLPQPQPLLRPDRPLDHMERPRMMLDHPERPRMMLNHQERPPFPRPPGSFNFPPGLRPGGFMSGGRPSPRLTSDFAPTDPKMLEICALDAMRTINIDGVPREIRFYGQTAVIFLSSDEPKEIRFQEGYRNVLFNDEDSIRLKLNDEAVDFELDGIIHKIRLGAPTRELYIDGKGFPLGWNTEPVPIFIDGKEHHVQLEGEPPPVTILQEKRLDLVAGRINMVVDGELLIPVYLDYKPQAFEIDGLPYVLQFMSSLLRVKINNRVFMTDFGGKPKPLFFHGFRHFLRLSALPKGIVPGQIKLYGMEDYRPSSPPVPPSGAHHLKRSEEESTRLSPDRSSHRSDHRKPYMHNRLKLGHQDKHFSMDSRHDRRPRHEGDKPSGSSDGFSNSSVKSGSRSNRDHESAPRDSSTEVKPRKMPSLLGDNINVNELFQKLVDIGIVRSNDNKKDETDDSEMKPVDFTKPETLKVRQPAMVTKLYSGMQCSTCGMRFQTEFIHKYSQHLDWHFRQNRRERDSARTVQSRQWYYDISDWIQFEEIEVLEERAQSWFESQVTDEDGREIPGELLSVPAEGNTAVEVCELCHDPFELFFHEETEEWHFRNAICVDKKLYHPACHKDWLVSLEVEAAAQRAQEEEENKRLEEEKKKEEEMKSKEDGEKANETVTVKTEVEESNDKVKDEIAVKLEPNSDAEISSTPDVEEQTTTVKEEPMEITVAEADPSNIKNEPDAEGVKSNEESEVEKMETDEPEPEQEAETVIADIEIKKEDTDMSAVADSQVDTTYAGVTSSIDGNVELKEPSKEPVRSSGKIKINISKPVLSPAPDEAPEAEQMAEESEAIAETAPDVTIDPNEPFPPGLEPTEPVVKLKPRLVGRKLTEYPPIKKGNELSGLCSIM